MKSIILLASLLGLALAQAGDPSCCRRTNCDRDSGFSQCQCRSNNERRCYIECSKVGVVYEQKMLNCKIDATSASTKTLTPTIVLPPGPPTPRSTSTSASVGPTPSLRADECICKDMCIMMWPQSCHCQYNNALDCFERCGRGKHPGQNTCEPLPTSNRETIGFKTVTSTTDRTTTTTTTTKTSSKPSISPTVTSSTKATPTPSPYTRCGGGRAGNLACPNAKEQCVNHPDSTGAPLEADGLGFCIDTSEKCGGFAGLDCTTPGKFCAGDDPADDCDPGNGGADCFGFCAYHLNALEGV